MTIKQYNYSHVSPPEPVTHRRKATPFQPRFQISRETADALQEITRLDQELNRFVLRARDYLSLVERAWAGNFHASTSLEGNPLTFIEVHRVTSRALGSSIFPTGHQSPYSQEIVNHLFAWLLPDALAPPWTVPFICRLHGFLLKGVDESAGPGELSQKQMTVVRPGTGETLFYGAPASSIGAELATLVDWINFQAPAYHPVVAAAILFHEFESIHPFSDGNGRVGRVLFHAYLQNAGLRNAHLCLIEQTLVADSDLYYRVLAWTDDRANYTDLVRYFTEAVLTSYREAKEELQQQDLLSKGMDEHRRVLMVQAKRHRDWFTVKEATAWTDSVVHATVRNHLNALVEDDVLQAQGETKSRKYRFKSPFHEVEESQAAKLAQMRRDFEESKQLKELRSLAADAADHNP